MPELGEGDPVRDAECPRCGHHSVVYNGNYWCRRERCPWVMNPERLTATSKRVIVLYLRQRRREALAKGDTAEASRMLGMLAEYAEAES